LSSKNLSNPGNNLKINISRKISPSYGENQSIFPGKCPAPGEGPAGSGGFGEPELQENWRKSVFFLTQRHSVHGVADSETFLAPAKPACLLRLQDPSGKKQMVGLTALRIFGGPQDPSLQPGLGKRLAFQAAFGFPKR